MDWPTSLSANIPSTTTAFRPGKYAESVAARAAMPASNTNQRIALLFGVVHEGQSSRDLKFRRLLKAFDSHLLNRQLDPRHQASRGGLKMGCRST
ncbi:MAG: hypothetical protein ACYCVD_11170 [Desulfitobacteriaceae bacterium]